MKTLPTERSRVLNTTEYKMFSYDKERMFRRKIDLLKIAMIEKNISKDMPIVVDTEYKILDGRHRYLANVELKCPIYFKVAEVANYVDLLKAATHIRKPTLYDFLLAHKDKLFYRKALEHTKSLPYSCEDIVSILYRMSINKSSNDYKRLQNGEAEFKKEYDFIVKQVDVLVTGLYNTYTYFHDDLSEINCYLHNNMHTASIALDKIKDTQGIEWYMGLYKAGHPELKGLFEFTAEVEEYEESHDRIDAEERTWVNYKRGPYETTILKYPNMLLLSKFYKVEFKRGAAKSKQTTDKEALEFASSLSLDGINDIDAG